MSSRRPSPRTPTPIWLWLLVAVACVAGGGLRIWQNNSYRAAMAGWRARRAQFLQVDESRRGQVMALFRNAANHPTLTTRSVGSPSLSTAGRRSTHSRTTVQDFEAVLNKGQSLNLGAGGTGSLTWTDPLTGRVWRLTFVDSEWTGYNDCGNPPGPPQPMRPKMDQLTERVRVTFAGSFRLAWGTAAWLLAMAVFAVWNRYRGTAAEIMLALALLCGTAWLVSPAYTLTIRGILSNDMLFWAFLMLLISGACLWVSTRRREEPPAMLCTGCGYDLTGNVSGTCPECGVSIQAADTAGEER